MMKMKLFAQATWVKLTTKNFEKLDDFNLIYNKKLLPIPYVSSAPYNPPAVCFVQNLCP